MASSPTTVLAGRYALLELVGEGGMGRVWRAHDQTLHRDVAVKEVSAPRGLEPGTLEQLYRRTLREARTAARLDHPGIVTVHDVVEEDGRPWIVMQYVPAPSLNTVLIERGPLPPHEVAAIGAQLVDALAAAHAAGVLHRDVKPGNVLLAGQRAILTDFGIATFDGDATMTGSGAIIGSPAYLAPERARREDASPAADLWSLGATLYAAVEGRSPYEGTDIWAMMGALLSEEPDPPRRAGPLTPVLAGLLQKGPARRMTAAQAGPLLQQIAASPPAPGGENTPSPLLNETLQPHDFPAERYIKVEPYTKVEPYGGQTSTDTISPWSPAQAQPRPSRRWLLISGGLGAVLLVAAVVIAATWTTTTGSGNGDRAGASGGIYSSLPTPTGSGTPSYDDGAYGKYQGDAYQADYPKGWTVTGSGTDLTFKGSGIQAITVQHIAAAIITPSAALTSAMKQLPSTLDVQNYQAVGGVTTTTGGAAEAEFTFTKSGKNGHARARVQNLNGRLVLILLITEDRLWQRDQPHYQRFVQTLRAV